MTGIPSPGIAVKHEEDLSYNLLHNHSNMSDTFGSSWHANGNGGHVDPSQLHSMGQNGMSGSFMQGNSAFSDDDLLASFGSPNPLQQQDGFSNNFVNTNNNGIQHMQHPNQQHLNNIYSSTPDGAPIRSPFTSNNFDYAGWNSMRAQTSMHGSIPANAAMRSTHRQQQQQIPSSSLSRSPMTPMTPNMGRLNVGTPEPVMTNQPPIPAPHRRSTSQQWDHGSLESGYSYMASPVVSPSNTQHPQISEVLRTGSNAGMGTSVSKVRSIEDKKAKRRASHNEVERKRRNNINNQIMTLSKLVPPHRLEDDLIRRSIQTNQTLPAHITGMAASSPPNGSLMSSGLPRRGVGSITQGLPIEEKDKNPAKGDVLNSSVGWMRDLLWLTQHLLNRESILQETIEGLGGQVPIHITEDENRMRTEVLDALTRNNVENFEYSRKHGSGLWVPTHTDAHGQPLESVSPENQQAVTGEHTDNQQYWNFEGDNRHNDLELKEEDEYGITMDME